MTTEQLARQKKQLEQAGIIWKAPVKQALVALASWWGVPTKRLTFIGLHNIEALERKLALDPDNGYYRGRLADYEDITIGEILEHYEKLRRARLPLGWA